LKTAVEGSVQEKESLSRSRKGMLTDIIDDERYEKIKYNSNSNNNNNISDKHNHIFCLLADLSAVQQDVQASLTTRHLKLMTTQPINEVLLSLLPVIHSGPN